MTTYIDKAKCPAGHHFSVRRKLTSAGRKVLTRCPACDREYSILAGATTETATLRERDIEKRLVKRVGELGGEVRKVQWVGRRSAPDRLVMLPPDYMKFEDDEPRPTTIWVELKAPGGAATFPKNAHEKAQHREHERMRQMGQRVVVVDSYEQIEEVLK